MRIENGIGAFCFGDVVDSIGKVSVVLVSGSVSVQDKKYEATYCLVESGAKSILQGAHALKEECNAEEVDLGAQD